MILRPILDAVLSQFASGTIISSNIINRGDVTCVTVNYYSADEPPGYVLGEYGGVKVSAYLAGLRRGTTGICAVFKVSAPISVDFGKDASRPLKTEF